MNFYMPTKWMFDIDVIKKQEREIRNLGKRCFIVCGKNSAKISGALDDFIKVCNANAIAYEIFDDIIPNPLMETCVIAGQKAHAMKADFVVGIGGGSVLDSTKVIALVASNPFLNEETIYKKEWVDSPLPSILIGLTAGTGSEVTDVSVMTNKDGYKKSIHDPILYATLALSDPNYMQSLPYEITLSTALDAFSHAFESYFSKKADSLSQGLSVQCISMLWPNLIALKDKEAKLFLRQRQELYEASILAGLAINTTGTIFAHNVGYFLTENYRVPHGFACAIFTRDILEYQMEVDSKYIQTFLSKVGLNKEKLIQEIESLLPKIEININEDELEALLPRWDGNATVNNTRKGMPIQRIEAILRAKFL